MVKVLGIVVGLGIVGMVVYAGLVALRALAILIDTNDTVAAGVALIVLLGAVLFARK